MRIIRTDGTAEKEFIRLLRARSRAADAEVRERVLAVIQAVEREGDAACDRFSLRFDGFLPASREVPRSVWDEARAALPPALLETMALAADNIRAFHQHQATADFEITQADGGILGRKSRGLRRVGLYVPGGRAAYPSTVLMNIIPAKIAGVKELIMVTPPRREGWADPAVLAAAALAGADRIFLIGGAQAVAALAYGTESVPKVDKIVGPGNIYVATAKKLLYGEVDIDMIAGPSEILVLADETANPAFAAADLLSQAEHDPMASAMLVTHSETLAQAVLRELTAQVEGLARREIISRSLADYGAVFITRGLEESLALANELAPEHLEVMLAEPLSYVERLDSAGALFLGDYAPEPLGDYFAGPNHVLPTGFTARFFSPLSVESFIKRYNYLYYTKAGLEKAAGHVIRLAEREGLTAHAGAARIRQDGDGG
ncbi:MAG: histidinol dehydrogenase [Peptococcaceae bacterium]|nr:histidinol dehydrogenase [Peptococcaceae bacterium]